jgi:hypothetical protein
VPEKAEWCGDNAVVLAWGGRVVVVGPSGEYLKYVIVSLPVTGGCGLWVVGCGLWVVGYQKLTSVCVSDTTTPPLHIS